MSGHNYFRNLKNHSTKQVKFKQDYHIGKAKADNQTLAFTYVDPDTQANSPVTGVCAAVAFDWLREKLSGALSHFDNAGSVGQASTSHAQHAQTIVANLQNQITYEESQGSYGTKEGQLAAAYGLTIDVAKSSPGSRPLRQAFADARTSLKNGEGAYLVLGYQASEPHHRAALYRNRFGQYEFFDPNIGEYLIRDFDAFFTEYQRAYVQASWNYQTGAALKVRRPSAKGCAIQ